MQKAYLTLQNIQDLRIYQHFQDSKTRRNQIRLAYNCMKDLIENGLNPFKKFQYFIAPGKYCFSQCIDDYLVR